MAKRSAAVGRFVVEIMVPEQEMRPSPTGVLVALEEGLRRRGYQCLVKSVEPLPAAGAWGPSPEERVEAIATAVPV